MLQQCLGYVCKGFTKLTGVNNPYFGEHVAGKQGQNWFGVASPFCSGCMEHKILSAEDLLLVPSRRATCSHQVASAALLWPPWAFLRTLLGQPRDLLSPRSLHAAPLGTGVCLVTGSSLSPCPCLHCSLQRKLSHSVSRGEDSLIYRVVSHGAVFVAAASNLTSSHLWIPGANGALSATIGNRVEILLQVLEKWFLAHFEPRPHPRVRQNFI